MTIDELRSSDLGDYLYDQEIDRACVEAIDARADWEAFQRGPPPTPPPKPVPYLHPQMRSTRGDPSTLPPPLVSMHPVSCLGRGLSLAGAQLACAPVRVLWGLHFHWRDDETPKRLAEIEAARARRMEVR